MILPRTSEGTGTPHLRALPPGLIHRMGISAGVRLWGQDALGRITSHHFIGLHPGYVVLSHLICKMGILIAPPAMSYWEDLTIRQIF